MYINPVLAGVLATLFVEMTLVFAYCLWCAVRSVR